MPWVKPRISVMMHAGLITYMNSRLVQNVGVRLGARVYRIEGNGRATILEMMNANVLSTSQRVNLGNSMSLLSSKRLPHCKAK